VRFVFVVELNVRLEFADLNCRDATRRTILASIYESDPNAGDLLPPAVGLVRTEDAVDAAGNELASGYE